LRPPVFAPYFAAHAGDVVEQPPPKLHLLASIGMSAKPKCWISSRSGSGPVIE